MEILFPNSSRLTLVLENRFSMILFSSFTYLSLSKGKVFETEMFENLLNKAAQLG
ncbi:hypothetical protein [Leptospira stimsonii]|uniref:hypothetical protein n=1 Tax=Leptospira stimsonii TaxID=2202203 RepID=UPI00131493C4|nr:hypothetical protein [Leptospira stimsonii]